MLDLSKFLTADDCLEISRQAQELALHAAQVELLGVQVQKFAVLADDFNDALKLYNFQKEFFWETLKEMLNAECSGVVK